jgi:putative Holliday junction resolvase
MPRHLGIDYGDKRIGLAIGDPESEIVSPLKPLSAEGESRADAELICRVADDYDVAEFVVGLPLNMDGTEGEQAKLTRRFARVLEDYSGRPVHLFDERLTSFAADELLGNRDLTDKQRRERRDALAAQCILTGYLKTRQGG